MNHKRLRNTLINKYMLTNKNFKKSLHILEENASRLLDT